MLIINPKTLNNIDVNLLSGIFNTAKMELDCEIIKVPYLQSGVDGKEVIEISSCDLSSYLKSKSTYNPEPSFFFIKVLLT